MPKIKILKRAEFAPGELKTYDEAMLELGVRDRYTVPVYNLYYPVQFLNDVSGANIMFPLEDMALFADVICEERTKQRSNEAIFFPSTFENVNTTSIGNAAYMALHHFNTDTRANALNWLQKYCDWFCEQIPELKDTND